MTIPTTEASALADEVKCLADSMARACAQISRARHSVNSMISLVEACDIHRGAQVALHAAIDRLATLAATDRGAADEARPMSDFVRSLENRCAESERDAAPPSASADPYGY